MLTVLPSFAIRSLASFCSCNGVGLEEPLAMAYVSLTTLSCSLRSLFTSFRACDIAA